MPEMRVLSLKAQCNLSAAIVPAIGAVCPMLERLWLPAELDPGRFTDNATMAATFPNLTTLAVKPPPFTVTIAA
jgi:hypothetical protein